MGFISELIGYPLGWIMLAVSLSNIVPGETEKKYLL